MPGWIPRIRIDAPITNMDYLVDNVIGSIPTYDELTPIGKATVDTIGIRQAKSILGKSGERS